jgi:hypothetical protein
MSFEIDLLNTYPICGQEADTTRLYQVEIQKATPCVSRRKAAVVADPPREYLALYDLNEGRHVVVHDVVKGPQTSPVGIDSRWRQRIADRPRRDTIDSPAGLIGSFPDDSDDAAAD